MSDLVEASSVAPEPVEWLWEELIPRGMITLVAGRPDSGKSLFAAWLASYLSNQGIPGIFSNREDPLPQVVIPRLIALKAKLEEISFWTPWLPRDIAPLEKHINEKKAEWLIMDPVAAHISASIYNDQDVRTALSPLSEMAWRTGCAVIMVHHTIKFTASGHPLRSIGGSGGGLPGAARAAFIFGQSPENTDERILAPAKFNLGPSPASCVFEVDEHEWIIGDNEDAKIITAGKLNLLSTKSRVNAERVLDTSSGLTDVKNVDKKAAAAEWLTNYLSFGTRKQNEIAEDAIQFGHSFRTLRRAGDDIGIEKKRVGFGKDGHWEWSLPAGHPALVPKCCDKPNIETALDLTQKCLNCGEKFGLTEIGNTDG